MTVPPRTPPVNTSNDAGSPGPASKKWIVLGLVLGLAGLVGLSCWVGVVAAHADETFNWEVASIFGTAAGTLALALATGALALSSSQDVRATRDLADLTRQDQAARERPLLVIHHAGIQAVPGDVSASGFALAVQMRNVGLGPALDVRLSARQVKEPIFMEFASYLWPTLMPREQASVYIPIGGLMGGDWSVETLDAHGGFALFGNYSDGARRRRWDIDVTQGQMAGPQWPADAE